MPQSKERLQLVVPVDGDTMRRLNEEIARRQAARPTVAITRAAVMRDALRRLLDAAERRVAVIAKTGAKK